MSGKEGVGNSVNSRVNNYSRVNTSSKSTGDCRGGHFDEPG